LTRAETRESRQTNRQGDEATTVTTAHDVGSALAAQRERSRAQVARYHEIRAALEHLRVTASSADRSVIVEMAAGGAIVDLRLTAQAMSKTPETLSTTILEAIRAGLATVAEQTAARVEPLTGRHIDLSAVSAGRLPALGATPEVAGTTETDVRFLPEEE
jgi:DNA-binding protein YbaB